MIKFWISALLLFIASTADAGTVRSKSGASATVADSVVPTFQCLINELDLQRYPIKNMRGCGKGSVRGSLHPSCKALDINQTHRNVTVPRMPKNEIALANGCGLISGAQWHRRPDSGHFQFGGWSGTPARHHRTVYVKAPKPRSFLDWLLRR